jgi:uncharacterized membrane protein
VPPAADRVQLHVGRRLTGKVEVALGFTIVSNIYTTVGSFLHERLWARIRWGTETR